MDYLTAELNAGELALIFLGNSAYTKTTSRRFFSKYGMISHIFGDRISLLNRASLTTKYHRVVGFARDELLLIALTDFAKSVQNRDLILYLIPGTPTAAQFIRRNREQLEAMYLLASSETLSRLLVGPFK